jgi:hypothetical protein
MNADGKVVANPTIGDGARTLNYVDGSEKKPFESAEKQVKSLLNPI